MTSKSINLSNILESINDKTIPGIFSKDQKTFTFPTIKYKNKLGETLEWTVEIKLKKDNNYIPILFKYITYPLYELDLNYIAEINIISNQIGGKIRKVEPTYIKEGKNIDKKNATNVITQAFKDGTSKYMNKLRKTREDIIRPLPMLLQALNSSKKAVLTDTDFKDGITIQRKYNGVRYVTYLDNDKIIQYSRTGLDYHSADYLVSDLLKLLSNLPEMTIGKYGIESIEEETIYKQSKPYLDGELYKYGKSLAYISGQARKENDKETLNYYIFDVFFPYAINYDYNMISKYRQEYLTDLFKLSTNIQNIIRVQNFTVHNNKEINRLYKLFIEEGYEGAIARKDNEIYKYSFNNYHSSNVLKIKPVYSDEFKIVDFTCGTKGKDANKIIWICELDNPVDKNDRTFNVVPNLSLENRGKLYICLSKYIDKNSTLFDKYVKGLMLTVEYAEISEKTGKPLQAKGITFRSYEDNKEDPIKKLYKECNIIE